jgi:hypothetical protein
MNKRVLSVLLVSIPIILSIYTHTWNLEGFPSFYIDEATYMGRALNVLNGNGPFDRSFGWFDHPYFGQLFLAGIFRIIGYPDSVNVTSGNLQSIQMLHLIPRALMGILAIIDTFLIYCISLRRYNKNVAFIAAVLFAVMPLSWFLRRILFDPIQLPFLLTSILLAVYTKDRIGYGNRVITLTIFSGLFLGLSIFTKIPAFTMIPLIGYIMYSNNGKNIKLLGLWFIPVIFIPLLWPLHAFSIGEFNSWVNSVLHQAHRTVIPPGSSFQDAINAAFHIDPILFTLGVVGLVYAAIKKDIFLLLWTIPFTIFLVLTGFVQYFHVIPLVPAFCIAGAQLITSVSTLLQRTRIQRTLPFIIITVIGIFGLVSTTLLINTNLNSGYYKANAFTIKYLSDTNGRDPTYRHNLTLISDARYTWIPKYIVYKNSYFYSDILDNQEVRTHELFMIIDLDDFKSHLKKGGYYWQFGDGFISTLLSRVNSTGIITTYGENTYDYYSFSNKYPFTNIEYGNSLPSRIEIRTNEEATKFLTEENENKSTEIIMISTGPQSNGYISPINRTFNLLLYWSSYSSGCHAIFTCTINHTNGWNDNSSLQISKKYSPNVSDIWSWMKGNETDVKTGERYQFVSHMKLNKWATQSHIKLEGYSSTSKSWYEIIQCPSGTNGPLEWKEFDCILTIPDKTTKVRSILNAGWSSEPNHEAITWFDAIYMKPI